MDAKTLLGLGAIGGAIYLATSKKAQAKVKKTTGLSNKPKRKRKVGLNEEALIFKKTKDSDLRIGKEVLYPSVHGNIDVGLDTNYKKGKIKKITKDYGIKEYHVGSGLYLAKDLVLIRK